MTLFFLSAPRTSLGSSGSLGKFLFCMGRIVTIERHHFSSNPDCNNTAEVPSFARRTLSAMPFVSDRWGVEVRWFRDKSSHAFPNSIELSVYTTVGACDGSKNFNKLFQSHVQILFYTGMIVSTVLPSLVPLHRIHDCLEIHFLHQELCDPQ